MEEEEEDCSSPPISLSVTCLLLWPSRLWWHREGVCSPWKQEAGYLSVRHVIIKRIPGGHVNTTQCLSFRRVHTWAKDSNWSVMQAHSAKMRGGLLWRFLLSLRLCCISVLVLTLKERNTDFVYSVLSSMWLQKELPIVWPIDWGWMLQVWKWKEKHWEVWS